MSLPRGDRNQNMIEIKGEQSPTRTLVDEGMHVLQTIPSWSRSSKTDPETPQMRSTIHIALRPRERLPKIQPFLHHARQREKWRHNPRLLGLAVNPL